jgi:hypothetical protein
MTFEKFSYAVGTVAILVFVVGALALAVFALSTALGA